MFINSKKEIFLAGRFFRLETQPEEYDGKIFRKTHSSFWASHGFDVSEMYADFYSRFSGIESNRYFSDDVYYFYALPALNRQDFMLAYTDKNVADSLFRGFRQPETVIKNVNGLFVDANGERISRGLAVKACCREQSCIVKPTVNGGSGVGVTKMTIHTASEAEALFDKRQSNYIVQRVLQQHSDMALLNKTSVNTIRIFTYRDVGGNIHYVRGHSFIRFGKKGAVMVTENDEVIVQDPLPGEPVNTVGAGDSMVAGFVTGYIHTGDYEYAMKLGSAAGSATACSPGLATREEIERRIPQ